MKVGIVQEGWSMDHPVLNWNPPVLAMEIDHGAFERQIKLPSTVDRTRVKAEQKNGLLWVHLPLRHH